MRQEDLCSFQLRKLKDVLLALGNNHIKLYFNLLWLCRKDDTYFRDYISQSIFTELIGLNLRLNSHSKNIIKFSTQVLSNEGLIKSC